MRRTRKLIRPRLFLLTFLILALWGVSILAAQGAPPETMSPSLEIPLPDFDTSIQHTKNPKLDSVLMQLATVAKVSRTKVADMAESQGLRISDGRVYVQIITNVQGVGNAIEAVINAGGEVTGIGFDDTLLQGWLPVDALETIVEQDEIYYIRRPAEVVLVEDLAMGGSTTEGLTVINGPAWHTAGYTGSGVKIGVIDGGFLGYNSLLGTDLPASVEAKNFVDGEDDSQVDGTDAHGTACAEIIHDIAPDATLYLAKILTALDLFEAVAWLKDIEQVDIISTSLGWYNLTPGDGTGVFANLVQDARDAGILWVTAAGNDRIAHWGGLYSDPDANNIHNFNGIGEWNQFVDINGDPLLIPAGVQIQAYVRWNDWNNVDQDYRLHLLRWNDTIPDWEVVAFSDNPQTGGAGQSPTEYVSWLTDGSTTFYELTIERINSTQNVNFEIFTPKLPLQESLQARSLSNLGDVPGAMTVAALDVNDPFPQEFYSSEGPTNGSGGAEMGGFVKPDISAFANVATESYLGSTFNGTSAATPHVAGAAALALNAYPDYTPDDIQSFLEGRAVEMGSAGKDTQFGHGQLYLGDPPVSEETDLYLPNVMNNYDPSELLQNGHFDTGNWTPWLTITLPVLDDQMYRSAPYSARLIGRNSVDSDYVYQEVTVPANATGVTLDYWYRVSSNDPTPADFMCVEIIDSGFSTVLLLLDCPELSLEPQGQWLNSQYAITGGELTPLLGQTVLVSFQGWSDATAPSTLWVDDVSFKVTGTSP